MPKVSKQTVKMSHFRRYPKSADRWNERDLKAYNIRVVYQDFSTFFGVSEPPEPQINSEILTAKNAIDAQDDDAYTFLRALSMATHPNPPFDKSATDNFGAEIFNALHYTGRAQNLIAKVKGVDVSFETCAKFKHFEPDVSITNFPGSVNLIQESIPIEAQQTTVPRDRHLPSLVAKAMGVFHYNNWDRLEKHGGEVIPVVAMEGTMPVFYKMPISFTLKEAVAWGKYPGKETIIHGHVPDLPRPLDCYTEGMEPLDNRRIILSCFEAFRSFVLSDRKSAEI